MGASRNEDILQAMIDGTDSSALPKPQSREERLLHAILDKMNTGGGGGGGGLSIHICTNSEYNHITGVPTIDNPSETTIYMVPIEGNHQYFNYDGYYNVITNQDDSQNNGSSNFGDFNGNTISDNDLYQEWVYVDGNWEKFGSDTSISTTLASLADVTILAPGTDQALVYDATSNRWINKTLNSVCFIQDGEEDFILDGGKASDLT